MPKIYKDLQGVYSSDFGHGVEIFESFVINEDEKDKFVLRKVTGDPNVPAGRVSTKLNSVPKEFGETSVPGKIQVRANINDVNGFTWWNQEFSFKSKEEFENSMNLKFSRINRYDTQTNDIDTSEFR